MAEEHEAIHEVGTDKTSTAGDENALLLGRGEQLNRRVVCDGRIGNGVRTGVVCGLNTKELGFLALILRARARLRVNLVVRLEVKRAEGLDVGLRVESKAVETDFGEWLTRAVHGSDGTRT